MTSMLRCMCAQEKCHTTDKKHNNKKMNNTINLMNHNKQTTLRRDAKQCQVGSLGLNLESSQFS